MMGTSVHRWAGRGRLEPAESGADALLQERVDELRRRVAWQVSVAYGLPLEEPSVPEPPHRVVQHEPEVVVAPAAEPEPESPPLFEEASLPRLQDLERVVASAAAIDPERAAECRWYLFYLRGFARTDGSLPQTFGLLVDTVFGPLLSAEGVQVRLQ
jgi:hypothetical protein